MTHLFVCFLNLLSLNILIPRNRICFLWCWEWRERKTSAHACRVKVFCSSDSSGHWSSDPAWATASPAPCHCTHIAPHTARSPNSRSSREEAGRGAETLAFPADRGVKLRIMSSWRKKPTKATEECASARLSSATARARHRPEQCLREPWRGLLAALLAGRRGSHSSGSPPAPERHVAGPTNAAETPVPGREGQNAPAPTPPVAARGPAAAAPGGPGAPAPRPAAPARRPSAGCRHS